jgi:hypothetical protein
MVKWLIVPMMCLLLFSGLAIAQTPAVSKPEAKKPVHKNDIPEIPLAESRLTFDYDSFDFGDVPPGLSVTHDFPFTNTGKDTLIISAVKAG